MKRFFSLCLLISCLWVLEVCGAPGDEDVVSFPQEKQSTIRPRQPTPRWLRHYYLAEVRDDVSQFLVAPLHPVTPKLVLLYQLTHEDNVPEDILGAAFAAVVSVYDTVPRSRLEQDGREHRYAAVEWFMSHGFLSPEEQTALLQVVVDREPCYQMRTWAQSILDGYIRNLRCAGQLAQ